MIGKRFSRAISWARRFFFPVMGNHAPAFTVASLATAKQSLPWMRPSSTTTPPEGHPPSSSYIPWPASAPISRRSHPGSNSLLSRSRAVHLPLACSLSMRTCPPPWRTRVRSRSKSATRMRIRSSLRFRAKSFSDAMTRRYFKAPTFGLVRRQTLMAVTWGVALLCLGLLACQNSASTTPRSAWAILDAPQHAEGHSWHVNGAGQVTLVLSNPRSGEALCAVVHGPWRGGSLDIPCVELAPEPDVVTSSTTHAHLLQAGVGLDRWAGCNSLNYLAEGPVLQSRKTTWGGGCGRRRRVERGAHGGAVPRIGVGQSSLRFVHPRLADGSHHGVLGGPPVGTGGVDGSSCLDDGRFVGGRSGICGVRDRYEALLGHGIEGEREPKVLMGSVADGVWHAPGQNTFVARWVEDAGGNMPCRKRTMTATWRSGWSKSWSTPRSATCG